MAAPAIGRARSLGRPLRTIADSDYRVEMAKTYCLVVSLLLCGCGGDNPTPDLGDDGGATSLVRSCETNFRYVPGMHLSAVGIAGEWNNFDPTRSEEHTSELQSRRDL